MQTLGIHDIGLHVDASHALHSMLKVLQGRLHASWQACDIDRADVLLAHAHCDPGVLSRWTRTGKPLVVVVDERMDRPASPFVLRQPIRVMQLMGMLESVSDHLAEGPRHVAPSASAWSALESLRRLMGQHGESGAQLARTADGALLWVDHGCAFAEPSALQRLRDGELVATPFMAADAAVPKSAKAFPLVDLAWFLALSGPAELAPWLDPASAYRLRRWPDFGRLGCSSNMLELSAMTATQPMTPAMLVQASAKPPAVVHRFLNAASMAGVCASAPVRQLPRPASVPGGMWSRIVGDLRRHLRLVA
jgi:hypothetical protein